MVNSNQTSATRDGVERAGDAAATMAQKAGETAKQVSSDVSEAVGQAADMAHHQLDAMTVYVRKNPLQATAIAAGVGFLFALIARR